LQAILKVALLKNFIFVRPILSAFRIIKETVEVSNAPSTLQLWSFAVWRIIDGLLHTTVASSFIQICIHSLASYELSKDFRNYVRSNFHSHSPKSLWLCLDAYNKVKDILNQINILDSFGFGLLVLYGIVDFSRYFHELITTTHPVSKSIFDGVTCFVFWLVMFHSAAANSNVYELREIITNNISLHKIFV